MEIWLTGSAGAGKCAIVDPVDFVRLSRHRWKLRNGYAVTLIDGKTVRMHRDVMQENDPSMVIDHINRDRLDNRRLNLRRLTPLENANNRVDNVRITAFGEEQTIAEWVRDPRCGAPYGVLQKRIYSGIMPELAILAYA
jgi:adenylylsulfate kinase-like enzyme